MCEESPTLPYDDGARTLYLYTKGTVGNPPVALRQLLRYMEQTTKENAVNDTLRQIHHMVETVKQDEEVALSYMKSWDREERIRKEERQKMELERQRAEQDRLKSEQDKQKAEQKRREAELERRRAELERQKAEQRSREILAENQRLLEEIAHYKKELASRSR